MFMSCLIVAFALTGQPPVIHKMGAIDCDLVEASPVVFHGKLYRFEYVREGYHANKTGTSYFRFIDTATGEPTPEFARGYHLGCAFVDGDTMYAYGVKKWGGDEIHAFWSNDLKDWKDAEGIKLPGWEIFNTSVCKGKEGYVMAFEIGAPKEEAGVPFTTRFALSKDARTWTLTPGACVYTKERYSACPALRYVDGQYYMVYLESYPGFYASNIVRSKDLVSWEESPFKPIMKHSDEDRKIANPKLSPELQKRIAEARDINNSDLDFCEFRGKTIITYSWGNQQGTEHLAEAEYEGGEADFLRGFFPAAK
jgi:alpha-L-fucosidase